MFTFLTDLKQRLATVPRQGLRYRLVNKYYKKKINSTKACTFYWVLIPSSAVFTVILGAAAVVLVPLWLMGAACVFSLLYIAGYYPAWFIDNKGKSTVVTASGYRKSVYVGSNADAALYIRGYNPRTGKFNRFQPWQILLPIAAIAGAIYLISMGALPVAGHGIGSGAVGFGHWLTDEWVWPVGVVSFCLFAYGVGRFLTQKRSRMAGIWDRLCPQLVLVGEAPSEGAEGELAAS